MLLRFENETSCSILNGLKGLNDRGGTTSQECVAVVKTGENTRTDKSFGCVFREEMTNRTNTSDFSIGYLTGLFNVVSHSEFRIQVKPKIPNSVRKGDRSRAKSDR
jgi:hypothetical protein